MPRCDCGLCPPCRQKDREYEDREIARIKREEPPEPEFLPISRPPDDGRDLYEGASLHRQERAEYDAGWPGPYNPIIHLVRW